MAGDTLTPVLDRQAITARLSELQGMIAEAQVLEGVLDLMDAQNKGRKGKARGTSATATRAGRGQRPAQFIQYVTENPGATVSEIAADLDVNPTYLYRLAKELVEDEKIVKEGKGYSVAEGAAAESADEEPEGDDAA